MEFFRIVKVRTTEEILQKSLTLNKIETFSTQIFALGEVLNENETLIGGIWGEFTLARSEMKGGVRFVLVECPNALAITITTGYPPAKDNIVIHLTINRKRKPQAFIDELDAFLDDQCDCLQSYFTDDL